MTETDAVQDEVRWLLATIAEEWPTGEFRSETVVRIDRDEPRLLEWDERRKSVDLARTATIAAGEGDHTREPLGQEFNYDVETIVSIRIEGAHEAAGGTIASKNAFGRLVKYAQAAINSRRTYPDVPAEDDVGAVSYLDAQIENEQPLSNEYADEFRTDFDVRLRGREDVDYNDTQPY